MKGRMRKQGWRLPIALFCQLLALQSLWARPVVQQGLQIVVIEGTGAKNVTEQITARPLTVRIQDSSNRPVAGATVIFTSPQSGPSGEFANDSRIVQVMTGPDGIANAGAFHPNSVEGPYQITVRAEYQRQTAAASILQTNISR